LMPNIWPTPISSTPDSKPGRYSGRGDVASLRFCIDYFYADPKQDIGNLLSKVGKLAVELNSAKGLYPQVVAS
ncbi:hypothetical protein ACULL0_06600, partial [Xanthomonas arboricola pv. corylina]